MTDWRVPKTLAIYPDCPYCKLSSGVFRSKYKKAQWWCKWCHKGFNAKAKEGT